jgi:hypothetical protein
MPNSYANQEILYLSYDGLTDSLGQSQIIPYLVGLSNEGYSITIVTFEKPEIFKKLQNDIEKICADHKLHWEPLKYHKSPPVLSTLYDLLVLRRVVKKLFAKKKFDIIHCRSYLTSLTGLWAKRRFDVKFIFDMRGFWADERIDGGIWNLENPLFKLMYKFFKEKEKQFIRTADHIISLTENAKTEIQSWHIAQTPISVIPTCVDMDLFDPDRTFRETAIVRKNLALSKDNFILAYLGSWGSWYMINEMLEFFSVLASKMPKSRLLILTGDKPDLTKYEYASRVIIKKVVRKEVPVFLGLANATICFIKPAFSKKASSATKIPEAWAMNLQVVTNPGWGDIERLSQSGMPLIMCDSKSEYERIASLLGNVEVKNRREMLVGSFDLQSGIKKYKGVYQSLSIL